MSQEDQVSLLNRDRLQSFLMSRDVGILGQGPQTRTAVLVPLVEREPGDLWVLFEKRSRSLRRQPGEIAFPGGHVDPDDSDALAAALRETQEELGIPEHHIQLMGRLDILMAWSGLVVYPFVGWIQDESTIQPNAAEVEEVFAVELQALLRVEPKMYRMAVQAQVPDDFPYHLIPHGRDYPWRTHTVEQLFFEVDGHVIWGLTARILDHFLQLVRRP